MRPANGQATPLGDTIVHARSTVAETVALFGKGVERLPVVDADGKTVGVLERSDVADLMMRG
jgi:glycine betaine/proline transport system ATP-binding protein